MFMLCSQCNSKPALTICSKGKLCLRCGEECHKKHNHAVELITHSENDKGMEKGKNVYKSMVLLSKTSVNNYPKRISKIPSRQRLTRADSQASIAHTSKAITNTPGILEDKLESARRDFTIKPKEREVDWDTSMKSKTKESRQFVSNHQTLSYRMKTKNRGVGVDFTSECDQRLADQIHLRDKEIQELRQQLNEKNEFIKHLQSQVEKCFRHSQFLKEGYEEKLRLLQNITSKDQRETSQVQKNPIGGLDRMMTKIKDKKVKRNTHQIGPKENVAVLGNRCEM